MLKQIDEIKEIDLNIENWHLTEAKNEPHSRSDPPKLFKMNGVTLAAALINYKFYLDSELKKLGYEE